jgi:hypothetical protein
LQAAYLPDKKMKLGDRTVEIYDPPLSAYNQPSKINYVVQNHSCDWQFLPLDKERKKWN